MSMVYGAAQLYPPKKNNNNKQTNKQTKTNKKPFSARFQVCGLSNLHSAVQAYFHGERGGRGEAFSVHHVSVLMDSDNCICNAVPLLLDQTYSVYDVSFIMDSDSVFMFL